jgi:small GTP-binding protein
MEVKSSNSLDNNLEKKDKKENIIDKSSNKTSSEKNENHNDSLLSEEEENEFVVNLKTQFSKRNSQEDKNEDNEIEDKEINSTNNLKYILTLDDNFENERYIENNKLSEIEEKEKVYENKSKSKNQNLKNPEKQIHIAKDDEDFLRKFNSTSNMNSNYKIEDSLNINNENPNSDLNLNKSNEKYVEDIDNSNNENESESEGSIKELSENTENIEYITENSQNFQNLNKDFSNQIKFEKILNINHDCNHQFRICLVGESNVGKTSLLNRYCDDQFKVTQTNTIGVDFKVLALKFNDISIKLQIWDTAGQERFRSISVNYFKSAHGFIIVYDITNRDSFNNLNNWIELVSQHNQNTVCNFIIGNKSDLEHLRAIEMEDGKNFAFSKKFNFMETSAKDNINIDIAFQIFTLKLMDYYNIRPEENVILDGSYIDESSDIEDYNKKIKLEEEKKIKKKKNCKC